MLKKLMLLACLFLLRAGSYGQVILLDSSTHQLIGRSLQIYQSAQPLTLDSARMRAFTPSAAQVPNLGISEQEIWVRFTLYNKGPLREYVLDVANTNLNSVELFYTDKNGQQASTLIDKRNPFCSRFYKDPNYLFDLYIKQGEQQEYYLKIKSDMPIFLPVYVNHPQQQMIRSSKEYLFFGLYSGIVLIMVVYNFFLFISIKDRSYFYYVVYILGVGLTQISLKGFGFQFLWPGLPGFEKICVVLFACISSIMALLFTRRFLDVPQAFPRINRLLLFFAGLFMLSLILLAFGEYGIAFQIMQSTTTISSIGVLIAASYIVAKNPKVSSARYFIIAWSILILGGLVFLLKDFSILPYNTFTNYAVQISTAVEMALLSFGLANRINILKKEKDESRLAALTVARENSRIIKEQNVILEQKVKARTEELQQKNETINNTLNDLKQTQSQLVEYEKMASLGQLTAGIAHEINNPINFVTSNIAPLKRDVDILLDFINRLEILNFSNLPDSDKKAEIENFKDEQDFDYLKTEINYLLKGIADGASRTAEIIKSLRIFSRLDEDDLKPADLNEGLESTVVILNSALSQLQVVKNYGAIPAINCYPGKLNQIFLNIISNAIYAVQEKFGNKPGGQIILKTYKENNNIYVVIEDNGTGMTEATRKKIFEPFFTTKDVGQGTGLGMSIAFNIILKHNGHISISSELGKGSIFTIQIPDNLS